MIPDELRPILIQLLGTNAYHNGNKVHPDFAKVMGALKYLILQMPIALRNSEDEDKEYGQLLLKTAKEMLEK